MLTPEKAAERVIALAERLRDLSVRRDRPHAFHEDKSELYEDMRKLAGELAPKAARAEVRERGVFRPGAFVHKGRIVAVQTRGVRTREPLKSLRDRVFA